jgi:predicted enzyme related to lactoylglutathione lyase
MGGGMIYTLLDRPGVKNVRGDQASAGGMMKSPPGVPHSFWLAYVGVDNCDKLCERATRLGATVTVPAQDIPNVGRFAAWMDPQGAAIAILQPQM